MNKDELYEISEIYLTKTVCQGCNNICEDDCAFVKPVREAFNYAYEKGYEDCRHYAHDYYKPRWHDLKENPKDVPDNDRDVLVLLWDCNDYYIGHYEEEYDDMIKGNTYWHFNDFDITKDKLDSILAWIELPKFKEK